MTGTHILRRMAKHQTVTPSTCTVGRHPHDGAPLIRLTGHQRAPTHLKCLALSGADPQWGNPEQSANSIVDAQVKRLRTLMGTQAFCQQLHQFQRALRQLGPNRHHAVMRASRAINEIQRELADRPLPLHPSHS